MGISLFAPAIRRGLSYRVYLANSPCQYHANSARLCHVSKKAPPGASTPNGAKGTDRVNDPDP